MFRKAFWFGGMLLLLGAAILVNPGLVQARGGGHGGGGHGGGFSGGGGHGGGFSGGGGHGGFHGSGFHGSGFHGGGFHGGGFHRGGFDHGIHHGDFHHGDFHHGDFHHGDFDHGIHHGRFHGGVWWYPGYYGDYGAWPYYSGDYPSDDYSAYDDGYDSGYLHVFGDGAQDYSNGATSADHSQVVYPMEEAGVHTDVTTKVTIKVPADAQVWFDGAPTKSTGTSREFQTPPLTHGRQYSYEVRARWNENGREVTQTQYVHFTAGAPVEVDFRPPPTKVLMPPSD
jgi:uncharacterized protein (TIGR03000 family)